MPEPWSMEQRQAKKRRIDKEVRKMAEKLGAVGAYTIVFFPAGDGQHIHMLDGGKAPMPLQQLFDTILMARAAMEATGGQDTTIQ